MRWLQDVTRLSILKITNRSYFDLLLFVLTKCARRPDLAQRFSGKEALAMDLGHEDGRGWYVVQVLWEVKLG